MKVLELISMLQTLDPQSDVVFYTEDESVVGSTELILLLNILNASMCDAERLRDEDRRPRIRFGKSAASERLAMVELTSIF